MEASAGDLIVRAKNELKMGKAISAISCLQLALKSESANAEATELLGIAYEQNGNRPRALKALQHATALAPGRASAHYNLALILSEMENRLDDAVEENQTALIIKHDHAGALALEEKLRKRLHDREWRSDENFTVVEPRSDHLNNADADWAKLECHNCGGLNFVTARTCSRCGIYLHGESEVIPVE